MTVRLDKRRARSALDKQLRRAALVAAARSALEQQDLGELRVEDVARAAGLAKASVFRYFPTKEELVLEVWLAELEGIFATMAAELARGRARSAEATGRAMAATLCAHPLYVRLSAAVHTTLARRLTVDTARRFKLALLARLEGAAAALEARLPRLPRGAGLRLLLRFHAAVVGLGQLADHPPSVAAAVERGGLDAFRIDFATEIADVFVDLLKGLEERS